MAQKRTLKIEFLAETDDVEKGTRRVEQETGRLSGTMGKAALAIKGAIGVAVAKQAFDFASELFNVGAQAEAMNRRFETVYGGAGRQLNEWLEDNQALFGASESEMRGMAATVGDLLIPSLGFTAEAGADLTAEILTLGNALSEWGGGQRSAAEMTDILTRAMLGEFDALKSVGIAMDAQKVQAELTARGLQDLTGQAKDQAEAQVILEEITRQSAAAMEQYEEGGTEAMRAQKELQSAFADLKEAAAELAVELAPLVSWLADLADRMPFKGVTEDAEEFRREIRQLIYLAKGLDGEIGKALSTALADADWDAAYDAYYRYIDTLRTEGTGMWDMIRRVAEESEDQFDDTTAAVDRMANRVVRRFPDIDEAARKAAFETKKAREEMVAEFKEIVEGLDDATDDIVDIWAGLPDDIEEYSFDVQEAIQNALETKEAQDQFQSDLRLLAGAGFHTLATDLANHPNRWEAIAAAEAFVADLAAAYDLTTIIGSGDELAGLAAQQADTARWQAKAAFELAGREHRAAYLAGLNTPSEGENTSWWDALRRGEYQIGQPIP
jgi:hypothetical protein